MKYTTALFSFLMLTALYTHSMQEPHQRKPHPLVMEAMEQLPKPEALVEHEGKATSIDRTIGCCMVLSIPCLVESILIYDKIRKMIYGDLQ